MSRSILSPLNATIEDLYHRSGVAEAVASLTDTVLSDSDDWRTTPTLAEFKSLLAQNLRARTDHDCERDTAVTAS